MKSFIGLSIILFFSFSVEAETYRILFQKGAVKFLRAGKIVSPPAMTGDLIKVPEGGLVVLRSQHQTLKLMGDTVITPLEDPQEGTVIELIRGAIVSQVTGKYKVKTRFTGFGVRGTQFFVQSNPEGDAWMCVQEGVVNVRKDDQSVDVPAGKGVFVDSLSISTPQFYAWTKDINWKMTSEEGELDQKLHIEYDLLENFYD